MTVCIATDNYFPYVGGISTFYKNLAGLLSANGYTVIILTVDYDAQPGQPDKVIEEDKLIRVYLKKTFFDLYNEWKRFFRPGGMECYNWIAMGLAMRCWLVKNYKAFGIDVIEVVDYGGLASFIADDHLPPVVITGHGSLTQLSRYNALKSDTHWKIISELESRAFENADAIIAHSQLNRDDLRQLTGREIDIALIPWQFKNDASVTAHQEHMLVIGSLSVVKGAITLAQALRQLATENYTVRLEWIGADGYTAPGQQAVSAYIKSNFPDIWNKSLIWSGELPHEKTQQRLRQAGIVVIPSVWETFNQVALEAAGMGKAIIMTDKVGAACLFTHQQNAYIIPAGRPVALANAIKELLSNKTLSHQIRGNAKELVKCLFDKGTSLQERMLVYERVLKSRRARMPFEKRIGFLKTYRKAYRKHYYQIRSYIKKLLKGNVAF